MCICIQEHLHHLHTFAMEHEGSSPPVAGDTRSTRRTYDCFFCKRGFTNAQALGGHMNIHRKERSKSKQYLSSSSSSSSFSPSTDFANPSFTSPPPLPPPTSFYPIIESSCQGDVYAYDHHARGDRVSMNPRAQYAHLYGQNDVISHEEFLGVDLSLGLRSMHVVDEESHRRQPEGGAMDAAAEDLDLELRLGHNHR